MAIWLSVPSNKTMIFFFPLMDTHLCLAVGFSELYWGFGPE